VDPDGDVLTYVWSKGGVPVATGVSPSVTLAVGTHLLTLTVDDGKSLATDTVTLTVQDTTAPTILSVTPDRSFLWPPDGRMVMVSLANIKTTDLVTSNPTCEIETISSNEPQAGDRLLIGPLRVRLKASRNPSGNGRTYTITVKCTDVAGNASSASTTVVVPINQPVTPGAITSFPR
jgi:hypothetical protein